MEAPAFLLGLLVGLFISLVCLLVAVYFQVRGIKVVERIVREIEVKGVKKPQMVEEKKDREEEIKNILNVQEDETDGFLQ
jgi:hypothetical protein